MNEHGRPIRSEALSQRLNDESRRAEKAVETLSRLDGRARRAELAALASANRPPSGRVSSSENGTMIAPVQTGPGAERIGPFLTSQRIESTRSYLTEPQGTGAISALREGEVWADTSPFKREVFDAQVDPARLVRYDEILVPYIGGKVWIRLFHDSGHYEYGPFEESSLLRFSEPRRFNGRLEIESKSRVTSGGEYIHALGGLELRESDWTEEWDLKAGFKAPSGGTVELIDAGLYPGGQSVAFSVEKDGSSVSKTTPVSEGDRLIVIAEDVDPTLSASFLTITYDYV